MFVVALIILPIVAVAAFMVYITVFSVAEEMYLHVNNRPFFVHYYPSPKLLTDGQANVLRHEFPFYNRLSEKRQGYFRHRVATFLDRHTFESREDLLVTDRMRVLVAATAVMLTFGMRRYLYDRLERIILYPDVYESTITGQWHKGEFNPGLGAVVFSWKHFESGFIDGGDNLHLGLHEFAHVVHYHSARSEDISAILFNRMYDRISVLVNRRDNRQRLIASNYFRVYAYTDAFEFLAVLIEHYFETPDRFRQEFPELFELVGLMLNHRH